MIGQIDQIRNRLRNTIRDKQINEIKNKIRKEFSRTSSSKKPSIICELCKGGYLEGQDQPQFRSYPLKQQFQSLIALMNNLEKYCPLHEIMLVGWSRNIVVEYPVLYIEMSNTFKWQGLPRTVTRRVLKWVYQLLVFENLSISLMENILTSSLCEAIISDRILSIEDDSQLEAKVLESLVQQMQIILIDRYPQITILYPEEELLEKFLNRQCSALNIIVYNSIINLFIANLCENPLVDSRIQKIVKKIIIQQTCSKITVEEVSSVVKLLQLTIFSKNISEQFQRKEHLWRVIKWCINYFKVQSNTEVEELFIRIINKEGALLSRVKQMNHREEENIRIKEFMKRIEKNFMDIEN